MLHPIHCVVYCMTMYCAGHAEASHFLMYFDHTVDVGLYFCIVAETHAG